MYYILKKSRKIQLIFALRYCDFMFAINLRTNLGYPLTFEHSQIYPSLFLKLQVRLLYFGHVSWTWQIHLLE
jgi:hypothetical protein